MRSSVFNWIVDSIRDVIFFLVRIGVKEREREKKIYFFFIEQWLVVIHCTNWYSHAPSRQWSKLDIINEFSVASGANVCNSSGKNEHESHLREVKFSIGFSVSFIYNFCYRPNKRLVTSTTKYYEKTAADNRQLFKNYNDSGKPRCVFEHFIILKKLIISHT